MAAPTQTPPALVERGPGGDPTAPPLDQGEAQAANEFVEDLPDEEDDDFEDEDEDGELDLTDIEGEFDDDGTSSSSGYRPKTEEEKVLFAPEGQNLMTYLAQKRKAFQGPPPQGMGEWLPSLALLARDPKAPPGVKALFQTIMDGLYPFKD